MHNKKIKSMIATLAVCTVLVGGTFAWLGTSDSVTNLFKINADSKSEIKIVEEFDSVNAGAIKTDTNIDKKVQIQNRSDYDSLIRADFEKVFKNGDFDTNKIILNFLDANIISEGSIIVENGVVTNLSNVKGKWVLAEGKYYYIGNVAPQGYTSQILDTVALDPSIASNPNYKGVEFDVIVNAESVQSTEDAITTAGENGTANENGFGLNESNHSKLVAALKAVVNEPSEDGKLVISPTNTTK